uniref:Protein kinase domain-containing protein n=1 Tax=Rhodosorus marinus TaxID=101924 RepID=A0A6T6PG10_9RHOD|mmetsp:Transcript_3179/g.4560  ORF Transcript_3179/g.4560 Transcript_3179/m.4560 type:complete len:387 (+) Transcript_3179:128-1288(+)
MGEELKSKAVVERKKRRRPLAARDVSVFEKHEQVGEGTYGQVWKAKDTETNKIVALKKVRMDNEREGFPLTAIREIKLLKMLNHENIVKLKEIVTDAEDSKNGKVNIYMVFEYLDHDLTGLMDTREVNFSVEQVKCCMLQLLTGLEYCHKRDILHRDIKGSNLLLSSDGYLKIADFGLARTCGENGRQYTNKVITRWYRPPELLLGANEYGPAVDMWSVGCLLAELLLRTPLFPGSSETDQLDRILKLLGSPSGDIWPAYERLPNAYLIGHTNYPPRLRQSLAHLGADVLDLIEKLLALDSTKRMSATEALQHRWFRAEPLPCDRSQLPSPSSSTHEFEAKRKKQQEAANAKMQSRPKQGQHGHGHGPRAQGPTFNDPFGYRGGGR